MSEKKPGRNFLKDSLRKQTDFSRTDQNRGVPAPPPQKPFDSTLHRVALSTEKEWKGYIKDLSLDRIIASRKSRRKYSDEPLQIQELSFLLWATQGIRKQNNDFTALRHVPSAGARHSFETYIFARNVRGLEPALYRFLPQDNELVLLKTIPNMTADLSRAAFGQKFVGLGAATFVWSCIPYRMEWRYGPTAYRVILMDAGHVCQNLYLACEAIGAATCAVAAYDQEAMDELIGLDGEEEFAIYAAPVGKALTIPDLI